jgi:modulator of FtsH protease HflK
MAWNEPGNDQDHDPWSGKKKSAAPPDIDQLFSNFQNRLSKVLGSKRQPSGNGNTEITSNFWLIVFAGLLIATWLISGFFVVKPAEQAVVLRFGQYLDTLRPGPHWVPPLIERKYSVDEQQIENYSYSSNMLTKDENIVSVAVAVQYRRANAFEYLFNVVDPIESLKQATASSLRQVIGNTTLDAVLTSGREQVRAAVQAQLVDLIARYKTGLEITDVALQPAKAPDEVKEAFDDAIKAQEDEQRYINQAQAYAKQVVPQAEGEAQRLLADARGYQQQVVLNAQGETARYLALLPQFEKAPKVTRERLYLAAMETVLSRSSKVYVSLSGNSNNMVYLPLDKWFGQPSTTQPPKLSPMPAMTESAPTAKTVATNSAAESSTPGYLSFINRDRDNYTNKGPQP